MTLLEDVTISDGTPEAALLAQVGGGVVASSAGLEALSAGREAMYAASAAIAASDVGT